ncbi:MAG: SDR family oxidoreductase [Streptomycetaceae bacterium]|nr:SDR family oxidoreductase [Streptomycetaceae bacterium]
MTALDQAAALVTGAAQGVGRATALALAARGTAVTVVDINAPGAHAVADEVKAAGGCAHAVHADVGVEADVVRAIHETTDAFGRLDILVNNAVAYNKDIEGADVNVVNTPEAVWQRTFDVNLRGATFGIRHAVPVMLAGGGGAIVNVGSTSGFSGYIVHVAYAASMAAKYSLTRSTATSHGRRGIRCNALATGLILSPTARANLDAEKLAAYQDNLLVPDFAEPEDIAAVIVFLASDESKYINGQTIIADGGFQAHQPWHAQSAVVHPDAERT